MGKIGVGDLVVVKPKSIDECKRIAITAWKGISEYNGKRTFYGNIPQESSDYQEWFSQLCNSAGYVLEILDPSKHTEIPVWIKVQFMCFEEPFWIRSLYFKKCK